MSHIPSTGEDKIGDAPRPKMSREFWIPTLIFLGIAVLLVLLLLPSVRTARPAAYRSQCANNLKQIALALKNYENDYHALPPAHTVDAEGKPLHSWRTLILPYTESHGLYKKIDLSKPWNDVANAEAYKAAMPLFLRCPSAAIPEGHTSYLASVGTNACFDPKTSRRLDQITDGLANTLMVIEVAPAQAVHWMAPDDADEAMLLSMREASVLAHQRGINAAFCDGRVRFLFPGELSVDALRALISIDGNDNEMLKTD